MLTRHHYVALAWLLPLFASGCAALVIGAAAGAGGTVYVKGKLEEVLNHSVTQVHEATQKGLQDLGLPLVKDHADKMSAEMKSGFSDGKDVWIEIAWISEKSCKIKIRVGYMGDQGRSVQILDAVKKKL
ncbi:MAG: DUF3568 family protein [Planctomycetes bacterium]|nr:DUF3568 family protein [Planctomycetota bacterium]